MRKTFLGFAFFTLALFLVRCAQDPSSNAVSSSHGIKNGTEAGATDALGKKVSAYFDTYPDPVLSSSEEALRPGSGCSAVNLCDKGLLTVMHCKNGVFVTNKPSIYKESFFPENPPAEVIGTLELPMTYGAVAGTKSYDPTNPPQVHLTGGQPTKLDGFRFLRIDTPLAGAEFIEPFAPSALKDGMAGTAVGYGTTTEAEPEMYGIRRRGDMLFESVFLYNWNKPNGSGGFDLISELVPMLLFKQGTKGEMFQGGDSGGGMFNADGKLLALNRSLFPRFPGNQTVADYRKSATEGEVLPVFFPNQGATDLDVSAKLTELRDKICAVKKCGVTGSSIAVTRKLIGKYWIDGANWAAKLRYCASSGECTYAKRAMCEKLAWLDKPVHKLDITKEDGTKDTYECPCVGPRPPADPTPMPPPPLAPAPAPPPPFPTAEPPLMPPPPPSAGVPLDPALVGPPADVFMEVSVGVLPADPVSPISVPPGTLIESK